MNGDVIERLARANPVPELPEVQPVERLLERLQGEPPRRTPLRPEKAGRRRARILAGAALAAAVCAAVLAFTAGSPDRGVNVLAAVYAATAPKGGTVESVTVTRTFRGPGRGTADTLREWSDAGSGRRRGLTVSRALSGHAIQVDRVYAPGVWEEWGDHASRAALAPFGGSAPEANVIYRLLWSAGREPSSAHMGFLGSGIVGAQFTQFYRALYQRGGWRVAGREQRGGRSLWRLEASPKLARARAREDHTRFYVLVDPHSFLPVYERLIDLTPGGERTVSESELASYKVLGTVNEALFDLAAQHPGARVQTQPGPVPRQG
jgi:hypothetical protein